MSKDSNNLLNIFTHSQITNKEEFIDILNFKNISIKRIISPASFSSEEFTQDEDEWIVIVQGSSKLRVEDKIINLKVGDSYFIRAKTPHQVVDTSKAPLCIWLAVHIF
jgi:cupin 2 domain-containing protein